MGEFFEIWKNGAGNFPDKKKSLIFWEIINAGREPQSRETIICATFYW